MDGNSTERIKRIIIERFLRHGNFGVQVMLYDDLPTDTQTTLLSQISLPEAAEPILVNHRGTDDWMLLTTCNLYLSLKGIVRELKWTEISNVSIDFEAAREMADPKNQINSILLSTTDGETFRIECESGPPLFGLWNALLMAKEMGPEEERRALQ